MKLETEFRITIREPGWFAGELRLFGCPYAMIGIQVHDVDGQQQPVDDPHDYLSTLQAADPDLANVGYTPLRIPGYDGEWVLSITPPQRLESLKERT